jgi:hypothetical protein
MSVAFPREFEWFVEKEISAEQFTPRDELIIAAVD